MGSTSWGVKLDGRLSAQVHRLTQLSPEEASAAAAELVPVLVRITGDRAAAERAGLRTEIVSGDVVLGTIALGDIERVAALDDVLSIDAERPTGPALHDSLPAIHADHLHSGPSGLTGRNIVIGVVDSGLDIFHHAFRRGDGQTRLLSLLDLTIRNTVSISGAATGGTFTLAWAPPPGAPPPATQQAVIAFNATAPAVQAALEALPAIDPGDIAVTGGPLPGTPVVVDFVGRYNRDRISPLWLAADAVVGGTAQVRRGREFNAAEINAALQHPDTPFPSADRDGHGTNVAGIAAGDGSQSGNCHLADYYVGVAPAADLVVVKTGHTNADNIRAAQYIFDRARTPGPGLPARQAIVNLSLFGEFFGARDGTDADDRAFDNMLTGTRGRAIIVAAGNRGDRYNHASPPARESYGAGLHSRKVALAGQTVTMRFIVAAGDRDVDLFELWYSGAGRLDVNLTTPAGVSLPAPVHPNAPDLTTVLAGHPIRVRSNTALPQNGRHRIQVSISPNPATGVVAASAQPWTITLTETAGTAVDVDCWIAQDTVDPYPRFVDADQDVTRTITSPGTANNVITVGAYDPGEHNTLAGFSSRGPRVDAHPDHRKPDLCAPGVNITAAKSGARNTGICCDCCTDFYSHWSGTSQATPHVTGIVALMFENQARQDPDPAHWLTFEDIRRRLVNNCDPPDPITAPTLPNFEFGAGIVNAEAAVGAETTATARAGGTVQLALPARAYASAYLPAHARVRELQRRVGASPAGQLAAYLVSTHVDEVLRLLQTDRRVVIAWHRARGPLLLQLLLRPGDGDGPLLPQTVDGVPVAPGLRRLLDELARCGSPGLRADVARYRHLALSLPGARLSQLDRLNQLDQVGQTGQAGQSDQMRRAS